MTTAILEHANITVSDPDRTAQLLCDLFDWQIRWSGDAIDNGRTVHVGSESCYLALYNQRAAADRKINTYNTVAALNHLGVQVDDLTETERRITAAGLTTHSHADYHPGKRFYFHTDDGIEIEVVCYH